MARTIFIRVLLLCLLTGVCDLVYRFTFYRSDLQEISPQLLEIEESQDSTDIYYFGESSDHTYHPDDKVKSSISMLIREFFPSLRLTSVNKNASHGGVYRTWLHAFKTKQKKPSAIIVTLNLRSFDATWRHSNLETQLQQSLVFARPAPPVINRFLLSLQAFDNTSNEERERRMLEEWRTVELKFPFAFPYKTVSQWDQAVANGGFLKLDGSWDMPKIELACHYIKGYAFNINEDNERLADFDAMRDWCEHNEVKLYLNLMAENTEYADSLVGKPLVYLMRANRDLLVKRYNGENCKVIDNLEAVRGSDFIDQNWTTEHYNQRGRLTIARNVATVLKEQFIQQYREAY